MKIKGFKIVFISALTKTVPFLNVYGCKTIFILNVVNTHIPDMEDIISDSMSLLMERSKNLSLKDQRSIGQELREWLKEGVSIDQLLTIPVLK